MDREKAYRLIDESMALLEHSLAQLVRIKCGGEQGEGRLRGPAYNIYVNLTRIQDNLRMLRYMLYENPDP